MGPASGWQAVSRALRLTLLRPIRIFGLLNREVLPMSRNFMSHNLFNSLQTFDLGNGKKGQFYSLPALESAGVGAVSKLPVSIRLVLESILRNCDGKKVSEAAVRELANWKPTAARTEEIPFVVARIVLQDFTGVDRKSTRLNSSHT